jgi:murein DD-endopeptidase MepM/ murein hydrolase activator NlpD
VAQQRLSQQAGIDRARFASKAQKRRAWEVVNSPVEFVKTILGADLWEAQEDILRSVATKQRTAVKACHSSGKTFIAAAAVLWWLARYRDCIVVTTAPTNNQVQKLLWGEIRRLVSRSQFDYPQPTLTKLEFGPKRYAIGFATSVKAGDEGVRFQGFHADHVLVILDEAPGVHPAIWNAIEGARAGGHVSVLALGNPTVPSGIFYDAFGTGRATWNTYTISAFDTPNLADARGIELLERMTPEQLATNARSYLTSKEWVLEKYREWGPKSSLYQSRVLGQFPDQADDALLSLAWLEAARDRTIPLTGEDLHAGIDVAGPGEAETVLVIRDGGQIIKMKAWSQQDPRAAVKQELAPFKGRLKSVNVDSAGIGYYFYTDLLDAGYPCVGINVGASPRNKSRFLNLKAELYWGLRMIVKDGDLGGLTDELSISQLAGIRWSTNPRNLIEIESKQDAAKRGVRSPDRAEAYMLSFAGLGMLGLLEFLEAEMKKEQELKAAAGTGLAKIDMPDNARRCPLEECASVAIATVGPNSFQCNQCGHAWATAAVADDSYPDGNPLSREFYK